MNPDSAILSIIIKQEMRIAELEAANRSQQEQIAKLQAKTKDTPEND